MEEIKTLLEKVLDIRASVLRDYILDLEEDLAKRKGLLAVAEDLESKCEPYTTEWAVIGGGNDAFYRFPIGYLEAELTKTKYDLSICMAELNLTERPQSKYDIEKIKQIPIKDFISRFTVIKNHSQAICPIHREKTPSLQIYEETNSWFCFGHGSGGSIIDFMMELNKYSLNEALDDLNKLV